MMIFQTKTTQKLVNIIRLLRESEQLIVLLVNNLVKRVFQDVVAAHTNEVLLDTNVVRAFWRRRRQRLSISVELVLVVTRVGHGRTGELLKARVLPLGMLTSVIYVEDATVGMAPLLPTGRQRPYATLEVELWLW